MNVSSVVCLFLTVSVVGQSGKVWNREEPYQCYENMQICQSVLRNNITYLKRMQSSFNYMPYCLESETVEENIPEEEKQIEENNKKGWFNFF